MDRRTWSLRRREQAAADTADPADADWQELPSASRDGTHTPRTPARQSEKTRSRPAPDSGFILQPFAAEMGAAPGAVTGHAPPAVVAGPVSEHVIKVSVPAAPQPATEGEPTPAGDEVAESSKATDVPPFAKDADLDGINGIDGPLAAARQDVEHTLEQLVESGRQLIALQVRYDDQAAHLTEARRRAIEWQAERAELLAMIRGGEERLAEAHAEAAGARTSAAEAIAQAQEEAAARRAEEHASFERRFAELRDAKAAWVAEVEGRAQRAGDDLDAARVNHAAAQESAATAAATSAAAAEERVAQAVAQLAVAREQLAEAQQRGIALEDLAEHEASRAEQLRADAAAHAAAAEKRHDDEQRAHAEAVAGLDERYQAELARLTALLDATVDDRRRLQELVEGLRQDLAAERELRQQENAAISEHSERLGEVIEQARESVRAAAETSRSRSQPRSVA